MSIDVDHFEALLKARRAETEALLNSAAESAAPVTLDQTRVGRLSRMDALQQQAMAQETERRRKLDLMRIDAALARIEADDYGWCVTCGEEIPEARLTFDPAAPTRVDCAKG